MIKSTAFCGVRACSTLRRFDRSIPRNCGHNGVVYNGNALEGVIDSASFADSGFGGRADAMNALGCKWEPSDKSANARLAGKNIIHARLALKGDGRPGLVVFSTCRNLIRTLPELCYSKTRPEDVDTDGDDHGYDSLRYGVNWNPPRSGLVPVRW